MHAEGCPARGTWICRLGALVREGCIGEMLAAAEAEPMAALAWRRGWAGWQPMRPGTRRWPGARWLAAVVPDV